jgi:YfiH family protein
MDILRADNLTLPGIAHGFFGRGGGVSTGIFAGLNCGVGSGDAPEAIAENRARVSAALGAELINLYQVHSAVAVEVEAPWPLEERPKADAMVTKLPGIALGIVTADCAPVLFAEPEAGVIAAAHAGWNGAFGGVLEATLTAMEALGAERRRIRAAIGPCIAQENYEVGPEFRARFVEADAENEQYFIASDRDGHFRFALAPYVASRLTEAGLGDVDGTGLCTYGDDSRFFSYRRATHRGEADYGRQVSAIALSPAQA